MIPSTGGKPRNVTAHPAREAFASFSRDGRWIYFTSNRTGEFAIWKISVSGGEAVRVSPGAGLFGIESADGANFYYVDTASANRPGRLLRLPLKGGEPVQVLDDVVSTCFDVLDKGIYYIERIGSESRLKYFDFASSRSNVIVENLGNVGGFGISASPDGRTILYSRVDSSVNDLMLVDNFR